MSRAPVLKTDNGLPVRAIAAMQASGAGLASIFGEFPNIDKGIISSIYFYDNAVPKPYAEFVTEQELAKVARIITTAIDVFELNFDEVCTWFKSTPLLGIGKTAAALVHENKANIVLEFIDAVDNNNYA
jgi:hypothetical protein